MTVRYRPTVTIAGLQLDSEWDGISPAALADIEFVWGRQNLYEENTSTAASITILDPSGLYATDRSLIGRELTVARPDGAGGTITQFRGRITELSTRRTDVTSPATFDRVSVWLVKVEAQDPLADLAAIYPVGPGQIRRSAEITIYAYAGAPGVTVMRPGYTDAGWFPSGPWYDNTGSSVTAAAARRLAQILVGGANRAVSSILSPGSLTALLGVDYAFVEAWFGSYTNPVDAPTGFSSGAYAEVREPRSALEMIRDIYWTRALGHVNYRPDLDQIYCGYPAPSAGLQLTLAAGKITLSPIAGLSIPADQVGYDPNAVAKASSDAGIDAVRVRYENWDRTDWEHTGDGYVELPTARKTAGSTSNRVVEFSPGFARRYGYQNIGSDITFQGLEYSNRLAVKIRDLVDQINDKYTFPNVTLDLRRHEFPAATAELILTLRDLLSPVTFPGSMFAHMPNVPSQFQIIGGTLRWVHAEPGTTPESGWVLDATLAPAPSAVELESIAGLVTNTTPTFADYDAAITLGDLAQVAVGLD